MGEAARLTGVGDGARGEAERKEAPRLARGRGGNRLEEVRPGREGRKSEDPREGSARSSPSRRPRTAALREQPGKQPLPGAWRPGRGISVPTTRHHGGGGGAISGGLLRSLSHVVLQELALIPPDFCSSEIIPT